MEDDFHIIVCEKSRCEGSRGATGLHDLFRKDLEELGSPDPDWFLKEPNDAYSVVTDSAKKIPRCDELSSHSSSTTEEDGISSSVRNIIKLIIKKSSTHSSRRTSCDDEDGFELSNEDDKTFEADESWSSSMATPSKNHSILTEVNCSPAINLNLETSELQSVNTDSESDSPVGRLFCDDEDEESTKTDFVFYGFEDPVAGSQINFHNLEQGQSVDSDNHVFFPKCVDVDESACVLNFLISTMNASEEFKLDMPVSELSEKLSFPGHDRGGGNSYLTPTECSSDKNVETSTSSVCNNVDRCDLHVPKTNEVNDANSLLLDGKKIGVSCSIKGKDCVNVLQLHTEQLIAQPEFSELPSVIENIGNKDENKISDTCAVVSSFTLEESEICTTSSDIDILCVHKMEETKGVSDAILDEDESSVEYRQSKKISDAACNSTKVITTCPDASDDKSNANFDRTRKYKEEPEYVTQILNLLCSPVNSSDSKSRKRKRIDDKDSEEVQNMHMKKEAECIVGELLDGLWEKLHYKLEEVEINSLVLSDVIVDVDQDAKKPIKYCVNKPNDRECKHVITAIVGKNLEESSCISLDKNLMAIAKKEQLGDVCSSIEHLEERSLSQLLMNSNSDEQTTSMGAIDEVKSNAAVLSSHQHTVSRTDATPFSINLLISPEGGNPVLHSSCSKLTKGISSDPQPLIGGSAEIKIEPENEMESDLNYMGTQDFLSCSVLEEVCQASEALAYIGKMKNDCLMGEERKSELKSVDCSSLPGKKANLENSYMSTGDNMGRKNVSQEEVIVDACTNLWTNKPPIPRSSMSLYDEGKDDFASPIKAGGLNPGVKGYHSHEEENGSIKSVKKKIMFSVPECSELNENELNISDEVCNEVVMESNAHCGSLSLKSSSCKQKNIVSLCHEGLNRFIYPKQGSQKKLLIPKEVLPEDLMSMASQLEKHSSLISNNSKSSLIKLKTGSLMSFSSLEPTECDLSITLDNKRKSISSEIQPFVKNKKLMQVVKINKTHEEVEDNTLVFDFTERDAEMVHIGKSTQLEKTVGVVQSPFTSEMMAELDSNDVNLVGGRESLAKVDECKVGVKEMGSEQNVNLGSRDSICTSPILLKKLRRKKPFRRRNKNQSNVLTSIVKNTLIEVIKDKTSKTEICGGRDNITQSVISNACINNESNSCSVTAENNSIKDKSEPGKIVDGNICCLKETLRDIVLDLGNTEDIEQIKKNAHIREVLTLENTSKLGVGSDILSTRGDERESSTEPIRNDNLPLFEKSNPVTSDGAKFSSVDDRKVAVSEGSLNEARELFSEDADSLGDLDDLVISATSGVAAGNSATSHLKGMLPSCEDETPRKGELPGFSSASGIKVSISEKSLARAKKLFAEDDKVFGEGGEFHLLKSGGKKAESLGKLLLKSKLSLSKESTPLRSVACEFSAGSGKKVAISEASLYEAKKLFAEDAESLGDVGDLGVSATSGEAAGNSATSHLKGMVPSCLDETPWKGDMPGFSSASGIKVSTSEKSLARAKKLFAEDADSLGDVGDLGISAASGKAAGNSATSHLKGMVPSCEDETPWKGDLPGFSSASGKKVSISEKSLARAKKLFAEDDKVFGEGGEFHLLKSGGKKAESFGKLLLKSKLSLSKESTPLRSVACEFSAGSGKKVAISEASLYEAKKLFAEDADSLGDVGDLGISAASGKAAGNSATSHLKGMVPSCEDETPWKGDLPGFASASGKKVSISEKSLARAKKLFAEDDKVFGEGGEFHLLKSGGKKAESFGKLLLKSKLSLSKESTPLRSVACEFSAGSGKKVAISEASLYEAKKLFAEDADSLGDVGDLGISAASGKAAGNSATSHLKGMVPSCEDETPWKGDLPGFASASGKKVSISEKSLARAKKLFAEDDKVFGEGGDFHLLKSGEKKAESLGKLLLKSKVSLSKELTPLRSEACGLSTASGRKVGISEPSLYEAKKLFAEDAESLGDVGDLGISATSGEAAGNSATSHLKGMVPSCEDKTPRKGDLPGFSSASEKKVSISEKSLARAKKLFPEDADSLGDVGDLGISAASGKAAGNSATSHLKGVVPSCQDETPGKGDLPGFYSASGKKVSISEKSLARAKKLFAEAESLGDIGDLGVSAASGEAAGNSAKSHLKGMVPSCDNETPWKGDLPGFSSASGKKVSISEKSLARAKKLFAEDDKVFGEGGEFHLLESGEKKAESLGKLLLKSKVSLSKELTPLRSEACGLSTASGRKVGISEPSLYEAKKLFAEDAESLEYVGDLGISAASGEAAGNSATSHLKGMVPSCQDETPRKGDLPGFSSASGKKVSISEKSLAHAKKLFAEDADSLGDVGDLGNSAASGEAAGNSATSHLKGVVPSCQDETPGKGDLPGFSSASGKKVSISEKSLARAKKLFAEDADSLGDVGDLGISAAGNSAISHLKGVVPSCQDETPGNGDLPGFSSASGKKVFISEKSLARAKKLFAEDDKVFGEGGEFHLLESGEKKAESLGKLLLKSKVSLSKELTPLRSEACGLSTASGRKVGISEPSLYEAKKLFAEDADSLGDVGDLGNSAASGEAAGNSATSHLKGVVPSCQDETPGKGDLPGFSSASGKKVSISEKSLARAKKLFAEDDKVFGEGGEFHLLKSGGKKAESLGKLLLKSKLSLSKESTPLRSVACEFSAGSGKKVAISEASLYEAKKLFAEHAESLEDVGDLGILPASGKAAGNLVESNMKGMLPSCEDETPWKGDLPGFSSASGKKVSISEKSLARAKKLFAEADSLGDIGDLGVSATSGEAAGNSVKSLIEGMVSSCDDETLGKGDLPELLLSSGEKLSLSEISLAPLKKVFPENLTFDINTTSVHPLNSTVGVNLVHQCSLQKPEESRLSKFVENGEFPNQMDLNSLSSSGNSHSTLPINKIEVVSCIGHMSSVGAPSSIHSVNIKQVSSSKGEPVLFLPNEQNVKLGQSKHFECIQERCITPTQDVFFAESQGDDYIKAVDVEVLNSPCNPLIEQNPPSPVFKTMRKRRFKIKRTGMKRKAPVVVGPQKKLDSTSPQDELRNATSVEGGFSKSSHSLNLTHNPGCCDEGKYSDLWGGDVADESWLSKQLELAEESNFEVKLGENVDHWAEGRKAQEEVISSKANVRPLIGHCLQVRRGMGQQRRSLRDFVKGKRPGRYTKDKLRKFGILEETLSVTSENAVDFQFKLQDYSEDHKSTVGLLVKDGFRLIPDKKGMFGVREAQSALLAGPGVDPNLLPVGNWCDNHYRWIVWKLASYEKSFPQEFGGRCLTPENLMCQLKYRWDREIDQGERSAIRKILEKDDTASKRMILCVSDIKKPAIPASSKKMELDLIASSSVLELTDGWYCINGIVDFELAHLIQSGRLTIGSKIVTSGGELVNGPPNGCSPLEPPASVARIRLSANSTRRARWDAKLGYFCRHPGPLPVSLHSLLPGGGAVGALSNVLLARVYPILSIEKTLDGRKVVRGKRAEARAVAKYEFERQAWLESVYAEVSAEMQREQEEDARRQKGKRSAPDGGGSVRSFKRPRKTLSEYVGRVKDSILSHSGQTVEVEELSRLVDESGDPSEVQKLLTTSQVDMISAYRQESHEKFQKELEDRVRQRIKQEEENLISSDKNKNTASSLAGRKNRDVVSLLKVRLVDADQPVIAKSAVLSIWRPSEDVISLLAKEGTILNIYGLTANGVRSNYIQLSSGKHTRYKLKKSQACTAHLMESTYSILRREILSQGFDDYKFNLGPGSKSSLPPFGEIDLVAIVIKVGAEPDKAKGQGFQYLYVAGSDASLLSIAFWGGIQEFAVEEFLHPGSVVAALNLQWRRLHGLHKIATLQAVETSTFTLNPVDERLKKVMKDFMIEIKTEKQFQSHVAEFIKSCEQKLDAVLGVDFKEVSSSSQKGSMSAESKLPPVSTLSVANSVENISPIRPSVAARMKKLQMYEGFMEIPLPTYHLKKSASVEKAFHLPKKCPIPSTTSHEINVVEAVPERCQSPQFFNSKEQIANFSLSENKNVQSSDANSPPMSLDSDPQE